MDVQRTREYWTLTREKLKSRYSELTDDDVTYAEGKEDIMLLRLQHKLGKTKEELREILINLNH